MSRLGLRDGWGLLLLGLGFCFLILIAIVVSYDPIVRVAAILTPAVMPVGCDPNCTSELYDLAAQQSMAFAAWAMVGVSAVSLAIGIWSVVLIRQNLIEARKVTAEAMKTAKASEEAVAAAQATNALTLTLGKAQIRAYMAVTEVNLAVGPNCVVNFAFANSGQSPARRLKLHIRLSHEQLALDGEHWENEKVAGESYFYPDMPAGEKWTERLLLENFLDDQRIRTIEGGRGRLEVICTFTYQDVFRDYWSEPSFFRETPKPGLNWRANTLPMHRRPEPSSRTA